MKAQLLIASLLASAAVAAEEEEVKELAMEGEFGLIVTTGNTQTSSLKAKITGHQELENWSNDFTVESLYKRDQVILDTGEDDTQTTAQKFFVSGQGNYKLENPDHRLFVFSSYEDDRFSNFDYQATIAGGWNEKLWKTETSEFEYSIGPGYARSETIDGETISGAIVRGALDYQWKISDTANFRQFLSTEVGSENTKSRSETSLSAQINGSLAMKVSLVMDHNTETGDDRKSLDTQTAVTLVYTFF